MREWKNGTIYGTANDQERRHVLLPTQCSELPALEDLKQLGRENIEQLIGLFQELQKAPKFYVDLLRQQHLTLNAKREAGSFNCYRDLLNRYLMILNQAGRDAEARMPLLPDLRPEDWVGLGSHVVACSAEADGVAECRFPPREARVIDAVKIRDAHGDARSAEIRLELQYSGAKAREDAGSAKCTEHIGLRQPGVVRCDEWKILSADPNTAKTWLKFCGEIDSRSAISPQERSAWLTYLIGRDQ